MLPHSGFVGDSDRLRARILPEETKYGPEYAGYCCDDEDCREWVTLETEPDPANNGARYLLCHVPECRMSDCEPPEATP